MLTADELLAGGSLTFEIVVPSEVLKPAPDTESHAANSASQTVRLRPLTVHDLQLITRAAKERDDLVATFMVQQALVEPEVTISQVSKMHVGLVQFLLDKINQISGITATAELLSEAADAPLTKAAFVLSREFGWTPQEISELTLGQVLLNLQMLKDKARS